MSASAKPISPIPSGRKSVVFFRGSSEGEKFLSRMLSSPNTMISSVSLILFQSKSLPSSFTCFERFNEASVQTAVESDRFGMEISVQRLELLITLYCGHGLLRLCSSLKINHG